MTDDYAIYPTYAISDARNIGEANRNYAHYYTLAADVTGIVQSAGFGSYSVANILRWEPSFTYPDYTGEYPGGDSVGAWQLVIVAQYDMEITLPDGAAAYKKYTLDGVNVTPDVLSGLLSPDSVPETEIRETFDNIRNNRAVQTYYFTHVF